MKKSLLQKGIYFLQLIIFLGLSDPNASAQSPTGTCTVLQQPCNGDGVVATTITSGMTPPLTFTYYDAIVTIQSVVNSLTDTFTGLQLCNYVAITDNFGNSLWLNTGMIPPFQIDWPVITDAVCPSITGSVLITINGGTMPDTVQWFTGFIYDIGPSVGSGNPMNLPPGNYVALVTDGNGCKMYTTDSSMYVASISNLNFSFSITQANCTDGAASVTNISGGIPPYLYLWSNGANTPSINNLLAGNYQVTVTDSQGCTTSGSTYVNQSILINVNKSVTNATCLQNDGSVISFASGGTSPYTYVYSNGITGQTASNLYGGTYLYITATDVNGCTGSNGAYINSTSPITVTYAANPSSCTSATGSATLTITGGTTPYTVNWNSFPAQSGITINNVNTGTYQFTVTDAVGCVRTGSVFIPPQSTISASLTSINSVCPTTTGSVFANVTGNHPPFTFLWNTGATTQNILNVPIGSYACTITDNKGCSVTKFTSVQMNSPVNIGIISTQASCLFENDGSVFANAYGGSPPYTYQWSNGQTDANATGLATGNYYVNVVDANGCTKNKFCFVSYDPSNDTCYCTITGKVFYDLNSNCQYDGGEKGVKNIMIHCSGYGYAFTDSNGVYSFIVPTGNYTISEMVQYFYPLAPCQNNNVTVNVTASHECVITVNFANIINPLHDIHLVRTCINFAIPGNSYTQGLIVQNDGTIFESNIQLGYQHDGQLQYLNCVPNVYAQLSPATEPNWYSVLSGFPGLTPGASTKLIANYLVPTNIPIGTTVEFWDTAAYTSPISSWLTDYTPWNNVENHQTTIIGSYDPNFKEVSPKGLGPVGYITTADSLLDYVIHFQNTGTYYAQNIIVTDTLDNNLDWTTLRPGYSDHNYTATVSEDGILKFSFKNIQLPWQDQSEMASRGMVTYSIKQKANLSIGTKIENRAAIYFDYNAPVITNTVRNTLDTISSGKSVTVKNSYLSIYPNPTDGALKMTYKLPGNQPAEFTVYDLLGRMVAGYVLSPSKTVFEADVSFLSGGVYFYSLKLEGIVNGKGKIVIIH